jgi:hydroxylaminobenzene mutase
MSSPVRERTARLLLRLGVLLFLLGLLTGFAVPKLANPRMGLASHLEGLMNGLFLLAMGLIWHRLTLSTRLLQLTFWLAIFGTFANWTTTLLAAAWGAGVMMPIAGQGHTGTPLQETVLKVLLVTLSLAVVAVCGLLLAGLRGEGDETPT